MEELLETLKKGLYEKLDRTKELGDEEVWQAIDQLLWEEGKTLCLTLEEKRRCGRKLFNSVRKLDLLQELIDDDGITEIMVNGTEGIFIEEMGELRRWEKRFTDREKLEDMVQQIAGQCNRIINESIPIADARLENGARVNMVLNPVALNGPVITIRRFPDKPVTMDELIAWESVSPEVVDFLKKLVRAQYNIFISGGTGAGKTTFLNALSDFIPKNERIITIEDNAELQIQGVENLVRLEARTGNVRGEHQVTIRDLIKASLRMRPSRIIVGEVRDSAIVDMICGALSSGHDGSLSTGHGNGIRDMLLRMETMMLMGIEMPLVAIRRQLASALDIMIHLGRLRDKSRRVLEVAEITGFDIEKGEILTQTLYEFQETGWEEGGKIHGIWEKKGELQQVQKLKRAGLADGMFSGS